MQVGFPMVGGCVCVCVGSNTPWARPPTAATSTTYNQQTKGSKGSPAKTWWRLWKPSVHARGDVQIGVGLVLSLCVRDETQTLWPLARQCLVDLSQVVETYCSRSVKAASPTRRPSDRPTHPLQMVMLWAGTKGKHREVGDYYEPTALNARLISYVYHSQKLVARDLEYSMVTDNGTGVGGLPLQNNFLSLPDGTACMAAPQAFCSVLGLQICAWPLGGLMGQAMATEN